ncbi:hypothetical protein [Leyella lascolaii]|uniref:hypothetical protein n=1 Tax=Leyella lascolaii TaxID=1776379 RepID=UPI0013DA319F|nr:hypothetical protein [Leyella lascolaii]
MSRNSRIISTTVLFPAILDFMERTEDSPTPMKSEILFVQNHILLRMRNISELDLLMSYT